MQTKATTGFSFERASNKVQDLTSSVSCGFNNNYYSQETVICEIYVIHDTYHAKLCDLKMQFLAVSVSKCPTHQKLEYE